MYIRINRKGKDCYGMADTLVRGLFNPPGNSHQFRNERISEISDIVTVISRYEFLKNVPKHTCFYSDESGYLLIETKGFHCSNEILEKVTRIGRNAYFKLDLSFKVTDINVSPPLYSVPCSRIWNFL